MARKKKKKRNNKNNGFKKLTALLSATANGVVHTFPVFIAVLVVGALFLGVKNYLYADSGFAIQKISVQPVDSISISQREKIEMKVLGRNILKVSLKELAGTIEKDPAVQDARVFRRFPGELAIEVTQRSPVAYIQFSPNGRYGLVSHDGMVLDIATTKDPSWLLVEAFAVGQHQPVIGKSISARGYKEAMLFLEAFYQHPLSETETITKIRLDRADNVTVTLKNSPPIHLGRRPAERIGALEKMIPLIQRDNHRKIEYIDLQFDNVIVKRKG